MTEAIPTDRIFSLSCFEGVRLFRLYQNTHPELDIPDLLALIENVEADAHNLDLEASVHLSMIVDQECPLEGVAFYQGCIKAVLLKHQPIWSKLMRAGRKRFINSLGENDHDIFEAAGLMKEPPSSSLVEWWDNVSGYARLIIDQIKMEQARKAEIMTIEYERKKLAKVGIDKEVEWPGFDDNFAGYDVLSYDKIESGIVARMIEVKSTISSPLRFILTRNEWDKAKNSMDSYIFHIWDMSTVSPVLYIRTANEISLHIPNDHEKGEWKTALVPVGGN
ncbi:MAG: DUF3883 domain-containing protein [Flavobacteriales bacterium]|nr:DUF3883 domain-containing protein [Flavobacteriales bacterium]